MYCEIMHEVTLYSKGNKIEVELNMNSVVKKQKIIIIINNNNNNNNNKNTKRVFVSLGAFI